MKDYYKILGVTEGASNREIKAAYRSLVKKYHPDTNKNNPAATERFKEISEAYETLGDVDRRRKYDQMRKYGYSNQGGQNPFGGFDFSKTDFSRYRSTTQGGNIKDILSSVFGGDFSSFFNFRQKESNFQNFSFNFVNKKEDRPDSSFFSLDISFLEAVNGVKKQVEIPSYGSFRIRLPAGIKNGQVVVLKTTRSRGKIRIKIFVQQDKVFSREGLDIYVKINLNFLDLGKSVFIPTIRGKRKIRLPEKLKVGQKLKLKNEGIHASTGERGDHYVIINDIQ